MNIVILVLSLLFVAVAICYGSTNVKSLPQKSQHSTVTQSSANHRDGHLHTSHKTHRSSHHLSSRTEEPTTEINRSTKTILNSYNKELELPDDTNDSGEVVKRNSVIRIFDSGSQNLNKSVEIELKTYTRPQNSSAIIEVKPDPVNRYETDKSNTPYGNVFYPPLIFYGYPPYNWYYGRPDPVPTEELLHGQIFTNNANLSPHVIYQYPVVQPIQNHQESVTPKPDLTEELSSRFPRKNFKNVRTESRPNYPIGPFPYLGREPQNDYVPTNTLPRNPVISLMKQPQNYPMSNSIPPYQYVISQSNAPSNFVPDLNEIQKVISINMEPQVEYKPGITKYVTSSYKLKTHPKLEWIPM